MPVDLIRRCPVCGERINNDAKICHHCQSPLSKWLKYREFTLRWLNAAALIATTVAIIFLILANSQTREMVRIEREALGLQQKDMDKIDSNLSVLREQINVQRETNQYQKEFNAMIAQISKNDLLKYIEENKPHMIVKKISFENTPSGVLLNADFFNRSKNAAKNVVMDITAKDSCQPAIINTYRSEWEQILGYETKIQGFGFDIRSNFVIEFVIRWGWPPFVVSDSTKKYAYITYYEATNEFSYKSLPNDQIRLFWTP